MDRRSREPGNGTGMLFRFTLSPTKTCVIRQIEPSARYPRSEPSDRGAQCGAPLTPGATEPRLQ
jgi:hypothetical protein